MSRIKVTHTSTSKRVSSDSYLFYNPKFLNLRHHQLVCNSLFENDKLIAQIHFNLSENEAISLPYAPFGGVDISTADSGHVSLLLEKAIDHIRNTGAIETITIKSLPQDYNLQLFEIQDSTLKNLGFDVTANDYMQYIPITDLDFRNLIDSDKNRYLNKSEQLKFEKLPNHKLKEAYRLIKKGRDDKGYALSMTLEEVEDLGKSFPENILIFGVFLDEVMVAASICIKVNNDILYDFHHDDDANYRSLSPTVFLIQEMYRYCQNNQYKILDLGGSMIDGKINQGLFNFKKSLGALASTKVSYRLKL
ncbi:GNAT family N-acetyltransferase [Fulvivirga sp. RKSG066]|uniref:GNAT family N-acetyltransferase n=1 Tax=Fulvivirga aurantia TaxID=2529383 RepID=UPI0012BC0D8B|nr:GNAT family N-acetyltransferase [Fulvivirga aurantia]MTI22051.1 GNAT family N-acetyltransferase [Fulvivirga aurantia]